MRRACWFAVLSFFLIPAARGVAQAPELFDRLDKNADGVVTADEVNDDAKTLFERLLRASDADGDGKLSKEEFAAGRDQRSADRRERPDRPPMRRPGQGPLQGQFNPQQLMNRLDRNGNGKIDKDEIPERLAPLLERADLNSDGQIERRELEAVAERLNAGAPESEPAPPGASMGGALLRVLDADGDGELSGSEIAGAAKALAKLDRNGDGKIDRRELAPMPPSGDRPQRPAPDRDALRDRLRAADTNGDGKISREEAPPRLRDAFDRIDANDDGQLDAEELRNFRPGRP